MDFLSYFSVDAQDFRVVGDPSCRVEMTIHQFPIGLNSYGFSVNLQMQYSTLTKGNTK